MSVLAWIGVAAILEHLAAIALLLTIGLWARRRILEMLSGAPWPRHDDV